MGQAKVRVNVVRGRVRREIDPPLAAIMRLAMLRPMPLPLGFVVKNGRKIWRAASAGMTGPSVSYTHLTLPTNSLV